jgi:ribosomal protein L12E/L44/L45/RPP1/RPP2
MGLGASPTFAVPLSPSHIRQQEHEQQQEQQHEQQQEQQHEQQQEQEQGQQPHLEFAKNANSKVGHPIDCSWWSE